MTINYQSLIATLLIGTFTISQSFAGRTHPVTGEPLADEQVFTYNMGSEPPSIDPQLIEDTNGNDLANDLFEGLLTENNDGSLAPGVAERWEVDETRKIYTFHLRHNANWSNGDPVTAHDFVYGWKRAVDPENASPQAGYMETMTVKNGGAIKEGLKKPSELGVKALDDFTFQVELELPLSYFPMLTIASTTMPAPRKVIEKYGDKWTRPGNMVSNGAYILKEHKINERVVLVRNTNYWRNEQTIIDKVVALNIIDFTQAFNRYLAGELDTADIPAGRFRHLIKEIPDETHSDPKLCTYFYTFNVEKPPFDDVRVRRALAYAIDRNIITKNIKGAGEYPAYTLTPAATSNFTPPEVEFATMTQKERDSKAKTLLSEAGFDHSNPLEINLMYNTLDSHKKIAIAISQWWKKKLGVKVTLENQEWKTFINTRQQGDFEVARNGFCGNNEASSFLSLVGSKEDFSDSNYINPVVDKLLEDAKSMVDPAPNYIEIEKIIATDFPEIPIYHYATARVLKTYVKGWPFKNASETWYTRNLYITAH